MDCRVLHRGGIEDGHMVLYVVSFAEFSTEETLRMVAGFCMW